MRETANYPSSITHQRRGIALLMVLLIVVAITILATGFLAGTDAELASGGNTLLRIQMDQLAQSGLDHARGLVLRPQEVPADFWTNGAMAQPLVADSQDYYDVRAIQDTNQPTDRCTYELTCEAYRLSGTEKTGRSRLAATLRLDPCIGLWANGNINFRTAWTLYGDLRSGGNIVSLAAAQSIDGDAFSSSLSGSIVGQRSDANQLSLAWPPVTSAYMNLDYAIIPISGTLSNTTRQPAIWRCTGDLVLAGNVTIQGMLLVTGNLTIRGNTNKIVASRNLPALYVSKNLTIENVNGLEIDGLVVVDQDVRISAAASNITVFGAVFVNGTLFETTADVSGYTGLVYGNPVWTGGKLGRALQLDGVDGHVDCGTNPAFNITSKITVAAWVNTRDAGDNRYHSYVTKGDHTYALEHDTANYIGFFIYDGTGTRWSARAAVPAGFNGVWHHLAGTYDGIDVRLYIDGVLKTTTHHVGSVTQRADLPL
jgi:hypothetical protein